MFTAPFDRERYQSAQPWPHLVVDDYFDERLVSAAEVEELPNALRLPNHRSYRQVKAESPQVTGPAAEEILGDVTSSSFVSRLEALTGIEGLQADKGLHFGGIHAARNGSFQAIHRDFRTHPETGLFHRLVVLVYLNSEWPQNYGGDLELWELGGRQCFKRIGPLAGRMVILEPSFQAIHGVPDPIQCPPERARMALVCHYYSETPFPNDPKRPLLRRPRRPEDPLRFGFAAPGDALVNIRLASGRAASRVGSVVAERRGSFFRHGS